MSHSGVRQPFVVGTIPSPVGLVPQVASKLIGRDHWGSIKARWGVGRMHYTVDPGLYCVGHPKENAPVFVTANYKMSFDVLRASIAGRDAWVLVLDTKGINVWCAAGKGTFGTDELIARIASSSLEQVVSHKTLILPQLGAPGVAAHIVRKETGFKVIYGPIQAWDIPAFWDAGFKATRTMRQKTFTLRERAALIPVELVAAIKTAAWVLPLIFLFSGLGGPHGYWVNAARFGSSAVAAILYAVFAGTVLVPLLLPWLPGRAFSLKGLSLGLVVSMFVQISRGVNNGLWPDVSETLGWILLIPTITAYLAMNFTGSSTYTSLSGVNKEMRIALPLQMGGAALGFILWGVSRFLA